jgi:glycosyltransferase involved in cell wall biosynthesis
MDGRQRQARWFDADPIESEPMITETRVMTATRLEASTRIRKADAFDNGVPRSAEDRHRTRTSASTGPLVSIGLPVYNGENFIERAVESILGQTYSNIEVIIRDNASQDRTAEMCSRLAAQDSRVIYSRNETNIGAARNYNAVFNSARGEYFKWAAHDDVLAPTFVERAVDVLSNNPDVVLCSARTRRIGDDGQITGSYPSDAAWAGWSAPDRFRSLVLTPHACVAVFGLIRRTALLGTPLIAPYVSSDRVLLAELGLRGRIVEIDEDLFFRRDHAGSSLRAYPDHRARVVWFDPSRSVRFSFPEWNPLLGYAAAVHRAPVRWKERLRCYLTLAGWSLTQWRPLLSDLKFAALGLVKGR